MPQHRDGCSRMVWTAVVSSAILPRTVFKPAVVIHFHVRIWASSRSCAFQTAATGTLVANRTVHVVLLSFITRLLELDQ